MARMGKIFRENGGKRMSDTERRARIRLNEKEEEYDKKGYFTDNEGTRISHEPHYYFGLRDKDRPPRGN